VTHGPYAQSWLTLKKDFSVQIFRDDYTNAVFSRCCTRTGLDLHSRRILRRLSSMASISRIGPAPMALVLEESRRANFFAPFIRWLAKLTLWFFAHRDFGSTAEGSNCSNRLVAAVRTPLPPASAQRGTMVSQQIQPLSNTSKSSHSRPHQLRSYQSRAWLTSLKKSSSTQRHPFGFKYVVQPSQ